MLRDLARSHAEEAGPYSAPILELIRRCDFLGLCDFEIDYCLQGLTPHMVYSARQALAFFQKLQYLDIGIDREKVGLGKFLEAERLCKETNLRLKMRRDGLLTFPSRVERVFLSAQRKIKRVLGDVPSLEDLSLRFGPGSTRKTRKADASIRRKCAEGVTCSEELFPLVKAMLRELPAFSSENASMSWTDEDGYEWDRVDVEILTSQLCFVFKNAKSFRLIGIEPLLNLMYQLGYGSHIAKRLAAFGVDIRDQTRNQRLAAEGSLTGALATLDLSSASDTVSREIVYELLPLDWAHVLARGRSEKIELPTGDIVSQEKFSAMGNGYTFPLETLIFWALSSSCLDEGDVCSVYGDDIVVPSDKALVVSDVLRYAGFNVNSEKSYINGPFRESCGKDYFEGIDVRPFYQKEWISGQSLFVLHNWYVRRGDTDRAKFVMKFIHPSLFLFGPDGFGDGHLIGDHDRSRRTSAMSRNGYGGYFFETFSTKSRKELLRELGDRGDYPASLYSIYIRGDSSSGPPRPGLAQDPTKSFLEAVERNLLTPGTPVSDGPSGLKAWDLPGFDGYKKIKIYTLGG
jgi:hypothetical protein